MASIRQPGPVLYRNRHMTPRIPGTRFEITSGLNRRGRAGVPTLKTCVEVCVGGLVGQRFRDRFAGEGENVNDRAIRK
jgi:hypothetical protein